MIAALLIAASVPAAAPAGVDEAAIERAIDNGRFVQAHEMIDRSARPSHAADVAALSRLQGQLALAENRNGDAFLAFSRALRNGDGDCRSQEGAGVAALRLGRNNAAVAALSRAVASCPERSRAWNALGVAHDRQGSWSASNAAYAKASALDAGSVAIANNRGYSLILQRKFDDAIAVLGDLARQHPDDRQVRLNLDLALVSAGKPPVPRQPMEPGDDWAIRLNNAGYVSYLLGRPAEARRFFDEAQLARSTPFPVAAANAALLGQKDARQ